MVNVMRKEMDLERIYLERLRKGSYKDFTKLYELYVSRLYAFALGLTHSDVLAKDIVQETFFRYVFQCIPIYDGQESIVE